MTPVHGFHSDVGCIVPVLHDRFHEQALHGPLEFLSRADFAELCICAFAVPLIMLVILGKKPSCQSWLFQLQATCAVTNPSNPATLAEDCRKKSKRMCAHDNCSHRSLTSLPQPKPASNLLDTLAGLPVELRSEVSQRLSLSDLAAVGATGSGARRNFWDVADVWVGLAEHHGCCAALAAAGAKVPAGTDAHASAVREAFRKASFRIDGSGLLAIFGGPAPTPRLGDFGPLFEEAAHVLSGLMPGDGGLAVKWLCEILSPGLRSYDATDERMAAAAGSLLKVVRRRQDILTKAQIERLVAENGHSVDLARLLSSVTQEHDDQLERQYSEMREVQLEALLMSSQA